MKLYIHPMSPNARRPRIVARLCQSAVEEFTVDLAKGEGREPGYLAINPNGSVPALDDAETGVKLYESQAICQYLAAKAGRTDLWPADYIGQANIAKWQFWHTAHFGPAIGGIIYENVMKAMFGLGEPDEAKVAEHTKNFHRYAKVLEATLSTNAFVAGNTLTLADIASSPQVQVGFFAKVPLESYPAITAWAKKLGELQAFKDTLPPGR